MPATQKRAIVHSALKQNTFAKLRSEAEKKLLACTMHVAAHSSQAEHRSQLKPVCLCLNAVSLKLNLCEPANPL